MLPLNQLTKAQRIIYRDTLAAGYEMKVTVQILTNQHAVVSTVSQVLLDGQVDAETVAMQKGNLDDVAVSRTCSLQLLDPGHTLAFDSSAPTDGALYLDRMIRVVVSVLCSFGWVDVPVFTGPVTGVQRDGDIVSVDAAGKETFGLRSAWEPHTYKRGTKVKVLTSMLRRTGEMDRYMSLPSSTARITKPIVVGRETKLWARAFSLVSSMDRHLFYDARGIVRTPRKISRSVFKFRTGNGGMILSEPQISFSTSELKNAIIIRGGDPAGPKKFVSALVVAPRTHPLSPFSIGRSSTTGRGGYLTLREENTHLRTTAKAVARGKSLLHESLLMQTEATWNTLPVWHLEPWDVVTLETPRFSARVRVKKFSMPLRADGDMTCGYQKNLSKPRRLVRPKR